MAEYSVMKNEPPPNERFAASHMPSEPASAVDVWSSIESVTQPSSPDSATTLSPGIEAHLEHGHRGSADLSVHQRRQTA